MTPWYHTFNIYNIFYRSYFIYLQKSQCRLRKYRTKARQIEEFESSRSRNFRLLEIYTKPSQNEANIQVWISNYKIRIFRHSTLMFLQFHQIHLIRQSPKEATGYPPGRVSCPSTKVPPSRFHPQPHPTLHPLKVHRVRRHGELLCSKFPRQVSQHLRTRAISIVGTKRSSGKGVYLTHIC